jgi:hypothetical protein
MSYEHIIQLGRNMLTRVYDFLTKIKKTEIYESKATDYILITFILHLALTQGSATAEVVCCQFLTTEAQIHTQSGTCEFVVDKVAMRQIFL